MSPRPANPAPVSTDIGELLRQALGGLIPQDLLSCLLDLIEGRS